MGLGLTQIRAKVAGYAAAFDAAALSPADAERVVCEASKVINMLETVRALAAARAAEGGSWRREGAASPAHELARQTGTSVAKAKEALDTAEKLGSLPALDAAARAGEVSAAQVAPIADAASADPNAERRLVDKAKRASLGELRDECARTKAAAEPDDGARHEAIRRSRHLRRRRCADGAGELTYRSTLEEVAEVFAVAQGFANREFDLARVEGRREPEEAYLADGLLAACRTAAGVDRHGAGVSTTTSRPAAPEAAVHWPASSAGPDTGEAATTVPTRPTTAARRRRLRKTTPTKIIVRVDWDALLRGWPIDGEVCEIAGLGPVAVSAVRAMIEHDDPFLAGVVTHGQDVVNVFHLGRNPVAAQKTALEWLSPTCITEGCNRTFRLENDHRNDWAATKVTLLRWLERHCEHCHDKKTRLGWALVEGTGKRPLVPPDDPRHPRHRGGATPRAG